jgi:hypothetical protein
MQLVAREALSQLIEKPESVERWSVFQDLLKGASRPAVNLLQFGVEIGKPLSGPLAGRLLASPLELGSPRFLIGLRQMAEGIPSACAIGIVGSGRTG